MSRPTLYRRLAEHAKAGRAVQVSRGRWRAITTEGPPRYVIVSRFVSSHASRARLHVNARTCPLRQTLRQPRNVRRGRDDRTAQAHSATGPRRARAPGRHRDERPGTRRHPPGRRGRRPAHPHPHPPGATRADRRPAAVAVLAAILRDARTPPPSENRERKPASSRKRRRQSLRLVSAASLRGSIQAPATARNLAK